MSFELKRKETVPEGIRRIICERVEKAVDVLDGGRKSIADEAVHEARKRFKQVRGALRLVRGELGNKDFDRENCTFRDAGRPLSEVRDAKVMIDTLNQLTEHFGSQLAAGSFEKLHAALESRHRETRKRVLGNRKVLPSLTRGVKKALGREEDWSLQRKGWKAIARGLQQTYEQGREAMKVAIRDDSDEAFHEWRKRAKDLRYALELLARAWPESICPLVESAHHLTDLLGQDHDLVVLEQIADAELEDLPEDEREMLKPLVSQRRSELKGEACELGQKIYAERAEEFVDRIHGYWKAWA